VSFPTVEEANATTSTFSHGKQLQPVNPAKVLAELFELLEEYGPSWYTEEHHNRAIAALLGSRGSNRTQNF
jgi:hypothetical protein